MNNQDKFYQGNVLNKIWLDYGKITCTYAVMAKIKLILITSSSRIIRTFRFILKLIKSSLCLKH